MADYKELLRRAVEALPENNGAARRAVYEKARAALVGQLRAINPPLAARDITAHRLQLEDCIRQVEQEASEAVIAGLGSGKEESPPPPPVYFETPVKKPAPSIAKPVAKPAPTSGREPPRPLPQGGSIEEIIAAANAEPPPPPAETRRSVVRPDGGKPMGKPVPKLVPNTRPQISAPVPEPEPEPEDELPPPPPRAMPARPSAAAGRQPFPSGRPLPSIVARAEAAKSRTSTAAFGAPIGGATRGPVLEPRRELAAPRLEPASRTGQHLASRPAAQMAVFNDPPVAAAMSAVREVDLDPQPVDPQGAIDRAIATLDREARGEPVGSDLDYDPVENDEDEGEDETPVANGFPAGILRADAPAAALGKRGKGSRDPKPIRERSTGRAAKVAQPAFPRAERERRGMGAVTIFLIVFAVLLVGAGGAGFWAWREGFVDLDQMFGRVASTEQQATVAKTPADGAADAPATGPGNTDTPSDSSTPAAELNQDERLGAETVPVADSPALPLLDPAPSEQRLGGDSQPAAETAEAAVAALDPANLAGSQSLLLEASDTGTTGAVPFSGTVEWSKGIDEMGVATLIGKANIPARNLGVDVLIRKNSDPSLPASHLMEVNFRVSDSFVGGSIAGLPGVLLKNEELVQGTPLVGASARVVGNSFLFALSASPEDITANSNLLTSRKWMDLALIYATGRRAIITLEKDEAAIAMFNAVVGSWGTAATASQ